MPAKKAKTKSSKPLDAIALLKQDHETVRKLLGQLENATGPRRTKLLGQIASELKIHTTIEEEIFYPAYRDAVRTKGDRKLFFEAVAEHQVVDLVLPEAGEGDSPDELKAKAKVLKDLVEHHAQEEERQMFPRARKVMERDELKSLGEMMQRRKDTLAP